MTLGPWITGGTWFEKGNLRPLFIPCASKYAAPPPIAKFWYSPIILGAGHYALEKVFSVCLRVRLSGCLSVQQSILDFEARSCSLFNYIFTIFNHMRWKKRSLKKPFFVFWRCLTYQKVSWAGGEPKEKLYLHRDWTISILAFFVIIYFSCFFGCFQQKRHVVRLSHSRAKVKTRYFICRWMAPQFKS